MKHDHHRSRPSWASWMPPGDATGGLCGCGLGDPELVVRAGSGLQLHSGEKFGVCFVLFYWL